MGENVNTEVEPYRAPFSFSELDRVQKCIASSVLPRSRSTSEWSEWGSEKHAFLRNVGEHGVERALALVDDPELREECSRIDLSTLPACAPDAWAYEVSFAVDAFAGTARELGRNIDRRYGPMIHRPELPGTVDVVGLTATRVIVPDYKFGFGYVAAALKNMQVRAGAYAAARAYGRDEAEVGIIRVRPSGGSYWDSALLDGFDLDLIEAELKDLQVKHERLAEEFSRGGLVVPHLGTWCRYCPAFSHCPAQKSLIANFLTLSESDALAELTPEKAAAAVERIEQVEMVLARVSTAVKAYAAETPLALSNGDVYGPYETPRTSISGKDAARVLADLYDEQMAVEAIEVRAVATQASIDKALRAYVSRTHANLKITAAVKNTMKALVEKGAARVTRTTSVKRYTPKKEK